MAAFGAAVLILGIVGYFLMPAATKRFIWQFRIAFWMTLLFVWLWLLDAGGRRDAEVADTSLFHAFQRFRKYLFWLVGAVLTGAIGSAVWSWCAPMLTKTP